jgi:hypothetical protein
MMDTSEIEVTGPDEGRIALDDGYGEYGEPVRLIRDETGAPVEFWVKGARSAPETDDGKADAGSLWPSGQLLTSQRADQLRQRSPLYKLGSSRADCQSREVHSLEL